jgi:hypothetical protein
VYLTSVDDLLHSICGLSDVQICVGRSKRVANLEKRVVEYFSLSMVATGLNRGLLGVLTLSTLSANLGAFQKLQQHSAYLSKSYKLIKLK